MQFTFVNHASYVLEVGEGTQKIRLLVDPWFEGTAFDNGWTLLAPSVFTIHDFKDITHLWFSHEHPDHFSPPILSKIPESIRAQITVLYHQAPDHKVVDYCRRMGFKEVIELPDRKPLSLLPEFTLVCGRHGRDSWLYTNVSGHGFLNTNDCVINSKALAEEVKSHIGTVDTLLTQFSYANWEGRVAASESRLAAGKRKIDQMRLQLEVFQPKTLVPFASFVAFCHEDNAYMNAEINTVQHVVDAFHQPDVLDVNVMFPGDVWDGRTSWNSATSLARWQPYYESRLKQPPTVITSKMVLFDHVQEAAKAFQNRLWQWYGVVAGLMAPNVAFYVKDWDETVTFSPWLGFNKSGPKKHHVVIQSQALSYAFTHNWGLNTLLVNGRFDTTDDSVFPQLKALEFLASRMNDQDPSRSLKKKMLKRYLKQQQRRWFGWLAPQWQTA